MIPLKRDGLDLEKKCPSSIIGPSGRKNDVIVEDMELPEMKVGDHILFTRMGAYTISLSALPVRAAQKHVFFIRKSSLSN